MISLAFYKHVVFPIILFGESPDGKALSLNNRKFVDYETLETAFESSELNEVELKSFLKEFLNGILCKIQVFHSRYFFFASHTQHFIGSL